VCSCGPSGLFTTRASKRTSPGAGDGKSDITPANASARRYVFLTCIGREQRDLAVVASRNCEAARYCRVRCGPAKLTFFPFSPYVSATAPATTCVYACITRACGIISPFATGCNATRTTQVPDDWGELDLIIISFASYKLAIARGSRQLRRFTRDCTRLAYLCVCRMHPHDSRWERLKKSDKHLILITSFSEHFPLFLCQPVNGITRVTFFFWLSRLIRNEFLYRCKAIHSAIFLNMNSQRDVCRLKRKTNTPDTPNVRSLERRFRY